MDKNKIIQKIRVYHKNISKEYFEELTIKELLAWLHPIDKKELNPKLVEKTKYENIFFNPRKYNKLGKVKK